MSENTEEMFELLEVDESKEDNNQASEQTDLKPPTDVDPLELERQDSFHYNIVDNEPTIAAAKAVLSTEADHIGLSDDDAPKILTTLESVTKSNQFSSSEVVVINEPTIVKEKDPLGDSADVIIPIESESEIAQLQLARLEKRSRPKGLKLNRESISETSAPAENNKIAAIDEKDSSNEKRTSVEKTDVDVEIPTLQKMHNRLTQVLYETAFKTPSRTIMEQQSAPGTIEIPRELIVAPHETNSPVIFNEPQTSKSLQNEDLIAILEGDGEGETKPDHHNDLLASKKKANISKYNYTQSPTNREKERQLAMKQIMTLPSKKARKACDLVKSLVSEWSDNESKPENVTQKVKKVRKEKKSIIRESKVKKEKQLMQQEKPKTQIYKPKALNNSIPMPIPTFKRARVIKKKIIWDPDAPETAISYASLIQKPTPRTNNRKPLSKVAAPPEKQVPFAAPKKYDSKIKGEPPINIDISESRKRTIQTPSPSLKKKKVSELDKLLADEGAVNMLYSLEHENNNADLSSQDGNEESNLELKTKTIKSLVTSQNKVSPVQRGRIKRAPTPQIPLILNTPKKEMPRKRFTQKTSAASSWDYIYSGRSNDDSMIVRRRSNSSYSSTTSPNRLSIDGSSSSILPVKSKGKDKFEFIKPNARKKIKTETGHPHSILNDLKDPMTARRSKRLHTMSESFDISRENKLDKFEISSIRVYEDLICKRHTNFVQLILSPRQGKITNSFTIKLMKSVTQALTDLSDDKNCKSVLITSANDDFCNGLDYSSLVQSNLEKRKLAARELSEALRNFMYALVTFKKPLIAGVMGRNIGIGVTILPLFDLVYATESSTYELPFANIGQIGEGFSLMFLTQKVNKGFINEMLYLCEPQISSVAHQNGIVTKVFNTSTFQTDLLNTVENISATYSKATEISKSLLNADLMMNLNEALEREQKLLNQYWLSSECQEKLKQLLQKGNW